MRAAGRIKAAGQLPIHDATVNVNRNSTLLAATNMQMVAMMVHATQRGLANGSGQHNAAALASTIVAANDVFIGIGSHTGGPGGGGYQQMDPTPYGGYTVGAQSAGSTLVVDDGTHFPSGGNGIYTAKVFPGTTRIGDDFTFTGVSGNTLTGCSGLPATIADGSPVVLFNFTNNGTSNGSDRPLLFDNNQSYSTKELFDAYTNSTIFALVLNGASIWTHGQASMNFPPQIEYMKAWCWAQAEICYQFAQNGTPITHVDVWTEYKGFVINNPPSGQGGSGVLQDGTTGVLIPTDSGAVATLAANYRVGNYAFCYYQYMYNLMYDAIKNHPSSSVNTIQVMGSHNNVGATTNLTNHKFPFGTYDGTLQASGFKNGTTVPAPYDRNRFCYFMDYSTGIDALSMDYSIVDNSDATDATEAFVYANYDNMRDIVRQIRSVQANRSGLSSDKRNAPIHFVEYYCDVNLARVSFQSTPSGGGFSDLQQAYMEGLNLRTFLEEGVEYPWRWQPMGDGNEDGVSNLWNKHSYWLTTQRLTTNHARASGAIVGESSPPNTPGDLLPAYYYAKAFVDNFPVGTELFVTACDDSSGKIWAISSDAVTFVANGYSTDKKVLVERTIQTVPAYGFIVVSAAS